jgi:hypothetical protein
MTTPADFVVWSVNKSLNAQLKYTNVKDKVMRRLKNDLGSITTENEEAKCTYWIGVADKLVAAENEARDAAQAARVDDKAAAGDDYWGSLQPLRGGRRGGSKRKRPSRKLRSSRKAQKKNRGFRRTRK